jgi:hypothetical protein
MLATIGREPTTYLCNVCYTRKLRQGIAA